MSEGKHDFIPKPVQKRGVARRTALLEAAMAVFLEKGYEAASLSDIVARAGGSRRTIYEQFRNKEGLFEEMMIVKCAQILEPLDDSAFAREAPADALRRFSRRFMSMMCSTDVLSIRRIVIAEGRRFPRIAAIFFQRGHDATIERVGQYLATLKSREGRGLGDPKLAALMFMSMIQGDAVERFIADGPDQRSAEFIDRQIDFAIDALSIGLVENALAASMSLPAKGDIMTSLFDPIQLGAITAPNRIFMAPLTRGRATRDHVPTPIMIDYYRQRASAGLIITEATGISLQGSGWPYAPGLWTAEQVAAWMQVTAAVHEAGGRIIAQLWHMGRLVHPSLSGAQPISASATTAPDMAHTYTGKQPNVEARALPLAEIPALLDDYRHAARNAMAAGFDGVQVHAANGYLIDQFLRDGTNFRHDQYGGSIENRIRLLCNVTDAVAGVVGADRTAVRLSPNGAIQGVNDSNPEPLFTAAAAALSKLGIAFLELREPKMGGSFGKADHPPIAPSIRKAFIGPLVLNSDYDYAKAQAALYADEAAAVTFGRKFLANPDLPHRLADNIPLNADDMKTWYSQGPEGYIDYPAATDLS